MRRYSDSLQDHGVSLQENVLTQLSNLGIYAQPALKRIHQPRRDRFVLSGEESGGAALVRNGNLPMDVGRYITFADELGRPLPRIKMLTSLLGSGRHALVLAPVLLRIEIYRVARICQLLVTRHEVNQSKPYHVRNSVVFRGIDGTLDVEQLRGRRIKHPTVLPEFLADALDSELAIPDDLRPAVAAATLGSVCVRCSHSHFTVDAQPADLSEQATSSALVNTKDREASLVGFAERSTAPEVDEKEAVLSEANNAER